MYFSLVSVSHLDYPQHMLLWALKLVYSTIALIIGVLAGVLLFCILHHHAHSESFKSALSSYQQQQAGSVYEVAASSAWSMDLYVETIELKENTGTAYAHVHR